MKPRAGLLAVLLLLTLASAGRADGSLLQIVFRVYDGPVDDPSKEFGFKDVTLTPGSKEAQEFVDEHKRSNPGLVNAYEMLSSNQRLRSHLDGILSITGDSKKIILADDSRKYVDRDKDGKPDTDDAAQAVTHVWPHSAGGYVIVSQSYLGSYPSDESIYGVIIHEMSHTQDHSTLYAGDYGPDGGHYANEIDYNQDRKKYAENAAWIEGWADFTPILYDPKLRADDVRTASTLKKETTKGNYEDIAWKDASFEQLLSVELINSFILYDISRYLPGGRDKIWAAFKATNTGSRDLKTLLAEYVRQNPSEGFTVAAIFEAYTNFKAPDSALDNILGKDAAARYRKDFRADLRSKNKSGTLAGAQDVSSYAAGTLLLAGAQARLNQIEKRLAELNKWKPSVWDYLGGPGWLLWKKWSNDREKAKLLTEKGQIEKTIESLKAAQAAAKAIAGTALTLPPPPGTLEEASTEAPGGESAGAGSGAAGAGRAGFEPGPGHAGIPAGSINGHPLEWGR